jgi:hypothetical protein
MPRGRELADLRLGHIPGADLAVDADFADPAGDELRVLGAEIQNQNPAGMNIGHGVASWDSLSMRGGRARARVSLPDSSALPW